VEPGVRLAETIAPLSLATDLDLGQPLEHALRACLLAVRLGRACGLSEKELIDIYFAAAGGLRRVLALAASSASGGADLDSMRPVFGWVGWFPPCQ
jgi:hypothetical protein